MSYLETIGRAVGVNPLDVNVEQTLSAWYGPDSLACHIIRPLSETQAEAYFLVGQNLVAPRIRPPMFDKVTLQDGSLRVRTGKEDAWQHFIDSVGIKVVPGHNLTGLVAASMGGTLRGFDFMRFKGFVLPDQEIEITGEIQRNGSETTFSPTIKQEGQRRAIGKNFRTELGNPDSQKVDIHWLAEIGAQGLGMFGMQHQTRENMVPVLMELGKSTFSELPVRPENILRSTVTLQSFDDSQAYGNVVQTIVGQDGELSNQTEVLVEFVPMDDILMKLGNIQS